MPAILVSLLFMLLLVSVAFPPLLFVSIPLTIVLVTDSRRAKRHQDFHSARLAQSELAMKIAKAVR
jgi:hypothetical protein